MYRFSAGGVWMASETAGGWFVVAVFAIGTVIAAVALLPGGSALKLDREGFETTSLYLRSFVRWQDATGFEVARLPVSGLKMVVFDNTGAKSGTRFRDR